MRSANDVTNALGLSEEEENVILRVMQLATTGEGAKQYAGIIQLYNDMQTAAHQTLAGFTLAIVVPPFPGSGICPTLFASNRSVFVWEKCSAVCG